MTGSSDGALTVATQGCRAHSLELELNMGLNTPLHLGQITSSLEGTGVSDLKKYNN